MQVLWNYFRLPSLRFAFQEEKETCLAARASPHDSVYSGLQTKWDTFVHQTEPAFMEEFPSSIHIRGDRDRRPVLKLEGSLQLENSICDDFTQKNKLQGLVYLQHISTGRHIIEVAVFLSF